MPFDPSSRGYESETLTGVTTVTSREVSQEPPCNTPYVTASRHRHRRAGPARSGFLSRPARPAAGQADRQLRQSQRLPLLLRHRAGRAGHDLDDVPVPRLGRAGRRARRGTDRRDHGVLGARRRARRTGGRGSAAPDWRPAEGAGAVRGTTARRCVTRPGSCSSSWPTDATRDRRGAAAASTDGLAIRGLHSVTLLLRDAPGHDRAHDDACSASRWWTRPDRTRLAVRRRRARATSWTCVTCPRPPRRAQRARAPCTTWPSRSASAEEQLALREELPRAGLRRDRGARPARTSSRSISASPAACCSRWRRWRRGSRWTSRSEALGHGLKLPPWEEPHRAEIEATLPTALTSPPRLASTAAAPSSSSSHEAYGFAPRGRAPARTRPRSAVAARPPRPAT